jgi:aryl-alcohol dehydrogenase-like predicted oxidoreductase
METRRLGNSGLTVPALSFGTATFGGGNEFFKAWGSTEVEEARRLVNICLDAGVNFFDTANTYSNGVAEEILGQAIEGKRNQLLISTKATFPMGPGPNDFGSSRQHLISACEASLRRLKTDHIDLYFMHGMDARTPLEETLRALDDLVREGKIRYIGCSNYSAWHLMKALSISEREGLERFVCHQIYYSAVGRDVEWELLPLGLDQGVSSMIWSPLASAALTGKIRRNKPAPKESRLSQINFIPYDNETLYNVVDALESIAQEREKSISQVALNWLLRKPTVANLVMGARNEEQLRQNLGSVGWRLTDAEVAKIDAAGAPQAPYPYWHQKGFPQLVPSLPSVAQ